MKLYTTINVFDATLQRMRYIYENEKNVMVSCSGGKDSTVVVEMAIRVAREFDRLPVVVSFLDQESEYQGTIDYMRYLKSRKDEIKLYWWQIPFTLTNSTSSAKDNYLRCWDPDSEDKWLHPKEPDSIHINPTDETRFHQLFPKLHGHIWGGEPYFDFLGIRSDESMGRLILMYKRNAMYKNVRWCSCEGAGFKMYPIYDWQTKDVWKSIYDNGWEYNHIYDKFYGIGIKGERMRVSSLIHETGHWGLKDLQRVEPETYQKISTRLDGAATYNTGGLGLYVPKSLPVAFGTWSEYRDYLIEHLIADEHKEAFHKRYSRQPGEAWAKQHVTEVVLNDYEGVKNKNARLSRYVERAKSESQSSK